MARHAKDEMNAERLDNPDLNDNNTVTQMHKKHNKKRKKNTASMQADKNASAEKMSCW